MVNKAKEDIKIMKDLFYLNEFYDFLYEKEEKTKLIDANPPEYFQTKKIYTMGPGIDFPILMSFRETEGDEAISSRAVEQQSSSAEEQKSRSAAEQKSSRLEGQLPFTFHVSRFTFHPSRFTLHAPRMTTSTSSTATGM